MTIHFSCTSCGKCCHDLRLPLGVDEAVDWLRRGGNIQVLVEAIAWPVEPPEGDLQAQAKRGRSFPAYSGRLPIRVAVTLAASFAGACPYLRGDMRCGAYEARPRVCRIYPAVVNRFLPLDPARKLCPPEAWTSDKSIYWMQGRAADAETVKSIQDARAADAADVGAKARLCALLAYGSAALANEGFVVYSPGAEQALAALETAMAPTTSTLQWADRQWSLLSNRKETVSTLSSIGARWKPVIGNAAGSFEYLGFFASDMSDISD
jgi:Fe-S-cluster containining protein